MKKVLFYSIITIFFLSAALFFVKKKAPYLQDDELIVGTNPNFPPFEFKKNGDLVGFEIDLMHEIGKRLNKKIIFKDMAFDMLLIEAQCNRMHMIASGMTPTPERAQKVLFTKPYLMKDPLIIITRADQPQPKNVEDLQGKNVVVNDGYTAESYMKKQMGIHLKSLPNPAEAFLTLKTGRADAYVAARSTVQLFFDQNKDQTFNTTTLDVYDSYALAVCKTQTKLFKRIQTVLERLEDDGTLLKLKEKWNLNF
jgi:arginine/lysine/histidine transporter system substrate-binding protein